MGPRRAGLIGTAAAVWGCLPAEFSGPPVIDITSAEYAFAAPDTVPAGRVTLRLSNAGREDHLAAVVPLAEGETIRDLMGTGKVLELRGAAGLLGGPVTSVAERASEVTLTLAPGRYALFCYLHAPDGLSHASKGMVREMVATGTPATRPPAADPEDRTIRLGDFRFGGPTHFRAGPGRLTIVNEGQHPHEVFLSRVADGHTLAEALAWSDTMPGTPWESYGATAALGPGAVVVLRGDFPPGSYLLECALTDPATGRSHADLGMTVAVVFTEES